MLEMLLHVLLWLFVITTDRISSLSQPDCGGEVSLDQGPVGHVLLPGPSLSSRGSVWSCSWVIEIPEGRTLLLELAQSPGGAGVSVLCGDVTGAHRQVLGGQGGALLKGCGGNQAHITWTGDGRSPDEIQLSYQVQEDERTSWSESDRTGPPSAQTLTHWTQTRTSFTGALPVGSEVMMRTEEVRGHLRGGEDSTQDRGPTSPLTGLWVAGRGTPPFPEEGPNNGAETSGTVHSTERPVSVTHPSFEHTLHTDVFTTETDSGPEHRQNQNQNQVYSSGLQEDPTPSTSNSPPSALYSTRGGATVPPISHDEDVSATPKPSQSHSWRIHRSTKRLGSDPVTSDPSRSPFVAVSRDSDGVHAGSPTPESYTPTPTAAFRSPARPVAPEWTAPNPSPADSGTASQSERGAEIHSRTAATQRTERLGHTPHPVSTFTRPQTTAENTRLPGTDQLTDGTLTGSAPTPGDGPASPAVESTRTETQKLPPSCTLLHEQTHQTSAGPPSLPSIPDSGPWYRQTTHSVMPSSTLSQSTLSQSTLSQSTLSQSTLSQSTLSQSTLSQSTLSQSTLSDQETVPASPPAPAVSPSQTALLPSTTAGLVLRVSPGLSLADHVPWSSVPGLTTTNSSTAAPSLQPPHRTTEGSGQETKSRPTSSAETSTSAATQRSTTSQTPRFYVVPDQPAVIKVESIELLLQITVEGSAFNSGHEEDATAWVEVFLKNTPGFSRVLGVWSSGRAVQVLVEFQTSGALRWLETTGLAEAAGQGQEFGSSQVVNITLGGVQGPVCDWLLQCPSGYKCLAQTEAANYTCSSVCRFDYCHHHGLCTHHPGGRPVCRCLVGEDFWYIGLRCDMRMTRTRLVGACLAILVVIVTVIGVLAFVAVRRYRAVLIQAKVDQTRSSYRRFNHFDELSGRFWLRSVAGSADSVDNPVFTRSDELLHLRALDRPCCYHDDTLSLASTCPSHGTRINTVYPHGSQYGWRGSELSVGEGVLDSGKASDLSVCSWPVEPIHWTPFPILQQLSSHGAATVRVSRPRSYCEGMELVEIGKSWTA